MAEKCSPSECVSQEEEGIPSDQTGVLLNNNGLKQTEEDSNEEEGDNSQTSASQSECVVCLQTYHHPVQLPCGHIFCFLCVKGVAARSQRCALCRADVPANYFDQPVVVNVSTEKPENVVNTPEKVNKDATMCKWFYEGRNGWWQYEDRASVQLEEAFINGKESTELVIAGFVYIVDIGDMVQYRKNYPTRRRRIKRDKASADSKGIAGLKSSAQGSQNNEVAALAALSEAEKIELPGNRDMDNEVDSVADQLNKNL